MIETLKKKDFSSEIVRSMLENKEYLNQAINKTKNL
uniref:Uncharacterized protein n=1 Tax=Nelumbo nucifera TaxID=4432 RepID=A0A822YR67_NELNU|nr:TPA_asm: hypothetical protein HUJ06_012740 [Nelumbo nucifera]